MTATETQARVKVFVSYSRRDRQFADELVLALSACGFEAYIDREDIAAGEDWAQRLSRLIAAADTVVYVLSPDSAASEQCAWEVKEAQRLAKRLLPVVCRVTPDDAAPAELRRLNYIFFAGEGRSFAAGLSELAAALRVDIDWIREHTRLGELADRWEQRGRNDVLLLRGAELDEAKVWAAGRPISAPAITDAQADFIKASLNVRAAEQARARRARAGLLTAVSLVAVVMTGLAAGAGWFWLQAEAAKVRAWAEEAKAVSASRALEAANARLSANIGLRAAPSDAYLDVPGGWFPVAANYSGALARIERRGPDGAAYETGSAILIDGGVVNAMRAGEPLLLVPADLGSAAPAVPQGGEMDFSNPELGRIPQLRVGASGPAPADALLSISFPVVGGTTEVNAGARLWRTPDHLGGVPAFELYALPLEGLPPAMRPLRAEDIDCTPFADSGQAPWVATLGVDAGGSAYQGERRATLYVSRLISRADPYAIRYDHATDLGAAGAAVFDLSTGRVLAIHLESSPDPDRPGRRIGAGMSLSHLLGLPRAGMDPREGRLPPLCEAA
jgi:hypothetical protein